MQQLRISNDIEVSEFNKKFNTNYHSIMIKRNGSKYHAIVESDIKIKMYEKEVINYFN